MPRENMHDVVNSDMVFQVLEVTGENPIVVCPDRNEPLVAV
jgi:hypothetical protein